MSKTRTFIDLTRDSPEVIDLTGESSERPRCPGCIHGSLGQRAHMEEPYGCLVQSAPPQEAPPRETRCPGCIYGSLGQRAHMEEPYGCLSDAICYKNPSKRRRIE